MILNIRVFPNKRLICLLFCLLLYITGCSQPEPALNRAKDFSCHQCHRLTIDKHHDITCTTCHKGNGRSTFLEEAHKGLVRHPASPENSATYCGPCHGLEVASTMRSRHYTLSREISTIWNSFFPGETPPRLTDIQGQEHPTQDHALVKDLMARRCLRCHVYYKGDNYTGTTRGKGCAACHLGPFYLQGHRFHRPTLQNCLSCHYSNFVGWDYVGRFESDYPSDFRAPLYHGKHIPRPYGIEWIPMEPDVHFRKGMSCTACHSGKQLHGQGTSRANCLQCHAGLSQKVGHRPEDIRRVDCQACHALWGFLDYGRSLMRQDEPDPDDWSYLSVQGSSEIEEEIKRYEDATEIPKGAFYMSDKIHGGKYPGLWFQAFTKRRWSPVVIGMDTNGHISVLRPLGTMYLSYVDNMEEVLFDNFPTAPSSKWRVIYPRPFPDPNPVDVGTWLPYHPHTIGKADLFRTAFIRQLLLTRPANPETNPHQ